MSSPRVGGEFAAQSFISRFLFLFKLSLRSHVLPDSLDACHLHPCVGSTAPDRTPTVRAILDPALVEIGANCVVGHDAVLFCHVIEGRRLCARSIRIDDDVTIGASVVIMPGVEIGKGDRFGRSRSVEGLDPLLERWGVPGPTLALMRKCRFFTQVFCFPKVNPVFFIAMF